MRDYDREDDLLASRPAEQQPLSPAIIARMTAKPGAHPVSGWQCGPVVCGDIVTVLAQYPQGATWNGWLLPEIDALACATTLDALNEANGADDQLDWHFDDDGVLVVVDHAWIEQDGVDAATERYEPDVDGLYGLGAWAWTWSAAE